MYPLIVYTFDASKTTLYVPSSIASSFTSLFTLTIKQCVIYIDILRDDKQVLYKRCEATDSTTLKQCARPVLEILQDKPYCRLHARVISHSNEVSWVHVIGKLIVQQLPHMCSMYIPCCNDL